MGQHFSLPEEEMEELLEKTHYQKQELKRWYKKFMSDYPDGRLDREQFKEIYGKLYTTNFSNHLADHIFNSFDDNRDGYISFKELMSTLSVTTYGTMREKLEWSFHVYDLNGDGKITLEEVCHVVKCMQAASRRMIKEREDAPNHTAEIIAIFEVIDSDSNGSWSLEEFIAGMRQHPELVKMLKAIPSARKK